MALKYPTGESLTGYLDSKIDTSIDLGTADDKIPTQKAVKEYVDNKIDIPGLTEKTNSTVLDKTFIYDVVADSLKKIDIQNLLNPDGKAIVPIGFTYIQLPGKPAPSALFHGGWNDISASFAGAFFRVAGGGAKAFEGGVQNEMVGPHSHSGTSDGESQNHVHDGYTDTDSANHTHSTVWEGDYNTTTNSSAYPIAAHSSHGAESEYGLDSRTDGTANVGKSSGVSNWHQHYMGRIGNNRGHTHTFTTGNGSGTETVPKNYTVKIWERVS